MMSSSRRTGDSPVDSLLGGGSPAYTASTGEALGAGTSSDAAPTAEPLSHRRLSLGRFHRGKWANWIPLIV
jgi:hypothetical protein